MELQARPGCCQEASDLSTAKYIPCDAPATKMVQSRDEEPLRMCDQHAHHSVRNRGFQDLGPYVPDGTTAADDFSAYEADAQTDAPEAENILARITRVVRELLEARRDVTLAEEHLKAAQQRVRVLEEGTLPDLMREAGQEKLRTADGYDVELGETLRASIPPANLPQAIAWLVAHGQAAIVKREVKLLFGRDEHERAEEVLRLLLEAHTTPQDKQFVHPMTLAAVVREMTASGENVPMDLLGAYVQPFVKVKEAKKKA